MCDDELWQNVKYCQKFICDNILHRLSQVGLYHAALSALIKVDGALRRVGGENDYLYYAGNDRIHTILKQ